jgi:hypothetical protein
MFVTKPISRRLHLDKPHLLPKQTHIRVQYVFPSFQASYTTYDLRARELSKVLALFFGLPSTIAQSIFNMPVLGSKVSGANQMARESQAI